MMDDRSKASAPLPPTRGQPQSTAGNNLASSAASFTTAASPSSSSFTSPSATAASSASASTAASAAFSAAALHGSLRNERTTFSSDDLLSCVAMRCST